MGPEGFGVRPKALAGLLVVDVFLDVISPNYRCCGDPCQWDATCPLCRSPLSIFSHQPDGLGVWCHGGCESGKVLKWTRGQLAERAVREKLGSPDRRPVSGDPPELRPAALPPMPTSLGTGDRNRGLFSYAAALRNAGLDEREIREHLEIANGRACSPPLSDSSLHGIARSAAKYQPSSRAVPAPGVLARLRGVLRPASPYDSDYR
jgi:hypothetical protein